MTTPNTVEQSKTPDFQFVSSHMIVPLVPEVRLVIALSAISSFARLTDDEDYDRFALKDCASALFFPS